MSRIGFLWSICWREVGIVPRLLQIILVTGPAVLATMSPLLGVDILFPWWSWAAVALVMFVGVVGFRVFQSAYVHELALQPSVAISDPIEDHVPWDVDPSHKARRRYWSVEVENGSRATITNCSVIDHEFVNVLGHVAPEAGRHFRLKQERNAIKPKHVYQRVFDLRGRGAKVGVDICSADETNISGGILMSYATSPTGPIKDLISPKVFPHWLTLRFTADNLREPIDKTFKIFVSEDGFLRMVTATDRPPPPNWKGSVHIDFNTDLEPEVAIAGKENSSQTPSVAPNERHLTKEQKETLANGLKDRGWDASNLWIRFASGCEECRLFAEHLADTVRRIGWNDKVATSLDEQPEMRGLRIVVARYEDRPREADLVASALLEAGVDFDWWAMPGMDSTRVILWVYRLK